MTQLRRYTHRLLILPALLAITLSAGSGCDQVKAPPTMRTDPLGGAYPRNVAIDGLEEVLVVDEPIVSHATQSQPLRVTVPVRSVADDAFGFQYRFIFFDQDGRALRQDSGWRHQRLEPRLQTQLDANSRSTTATDWRMEIRSAR